MKSKDRDFEIDKTKGIIFTNAFNVLKRYINKEKKSETTKANQLYTYLKSNLTGCVINGGLEGVITEAELDRLYKEFCERE